MKSHLVPIGNSKGIRIPKAFLMLCHIEKEVDLRVEGQTIIIKPTKEKKSREGWGEAFKKMHKNKDDQLLISDNLDLDTGTWEW